jgi:hypothetical protein
MPTPIRWIDAPLKGLLAILARPRAGEWLRDEIFSYGNNQLVGNGSAGSFRTTVPVN